MNVDAAFLAIYGRIPNSEETSRFNRVAKELGIRDNDAIWAMVFLLGHHLDLTKEMPERMAQLVSQSLEEYTSALLCARRSAEAEFAAVKARTEANVVQAAVRSIQNEIARAAQKVAHDAAHKSWLQWLGGAAIVGMLMMGGSFYWGYGIGNSNGYADALDVKTASSWAASATGQAAYRLDQNGDLKSLIRCDRDGWKIESAKDGKHKICLVGATGDGMISGWYLP